MICNDFIDIKLFTVYHSVIIITLTKKFITNLVLTETFLQSLNYLNHCDTVLEAVRCLDLFAVCDLFLLPKVGCNVSFLRIS